MLQTRLVVRWLQMYGLPLLFLVGWLVILSQGSTWATPAHATHSDPLKFPKQAHHFKFDSPQVAAASLSSSKPVIGAAPVSQPDFQSLGRGQSGEFLRPERFRRDASLPSWGARVLRALSAAITSTLGATRRSPHESAGSA